MNTLFDIYSAWNAQVQLPGNVSQTEATDILQTFAPNVSDADGDAWWVAVATYYDAAGIIAQPDYVQLRNHANNNEAGANTLFAGLGVAMNALPESAVVNEDLALQGAIDSQAEVDPNKTRIEALKSGGTSVADVQFDQALDIAIDALDGLDSSLTDQINSLTPPPETAQQAAAAEIAGAEALAVPPAAPQPPRGRNNG